MVDEEARPLLDVLTAMTAAGSVETELDRRRS